MSDCRAYELYNTLWDVLDHDGDYRVYHSSDGHLYRSQIHGYAHKETRQDVGDFTRRHEHNDGNAEGNIIQEAYFHPSLMEGKFMLVDAFWSKSNQNMLSVPTKAMSVNEVSTSASDDAEMSSNCLNPQTMPVSGDSFFLNDPIFQDANTVDEDNLCSLPFGVSAECVNFSFPENEYDGTGKNDLWMSKCLESPDLSQFEDFEKIEELSLFLSDDHLCFGPQPSLVHQEPSMTLLPDSCESSFGKDESSGLINGCFSHSLDTDCADLEFQAKSERKFSQYACQSRTSSYSSQSHDLFINPTQDAQNDKKKFLNSDTSASEIFSHQPDGPPDCLVGPNLFDRIYPQDAHFQSDHSRYHGGTFKTRSKLFPKSENQLCEKVSFQAVSRGSLFDVRMHQLNSSFPVEMPDQQLSGSQNSRKKRLRNQEEQAVDDCQLLGSIKKNINREADLFAKPENFCRASPCTENISLGPINFQELQNSLDKLDIRTKLCLRDGLYRLARSAEQRRSFGDSRTCSVDSDRFSEFVDIETGTNPIDRTIAYLLIHSDSRDSTFNFNDAMSLDSHVMVNNEPFGSCWHIYAGMPPTCRHVSRHYMPVLKGGQPR